ncbi:amino acid adenylation domain-containing protein/thioester reductase-like protein [Actinopolyspora biskrensis]|uniref:Amino acid adenylation domain-containing protein/thioester reductase-like protein n=1 Tax=Actinopolyspora biskrensis TaxID=1470178 RepID=A0A852Z5P9_9ACTN|nr:amino acid adenylation domain-containing SDR family oxidoreductase [Actinopolyspora biskrensis]NYH77707.1 amino acid adenylation domain-containing protein/thioester reductase-like protein [Actinopolyspora biskrensis]
MTIEASSTLENRVAEWNTTATDYPREALIHHLFEEQARARPQATAVGSGEDALTYGGLDTAANALAAKLVSAGVRPGDLVGVLIKSSAEAVAGIMAVLKAGAAYVPLDPDHPDERLRSMCEQVGIRVVLTTRATHPRIGPDRIAAPVRLDDTAPEPPDTPERSATDLAYVIFTSGSSGQPKAVAVPHRGAVRLVRGTDHVGFGTEDTVLSTINLCFDISCWEIFGALLNGSRLVFVSTETLLSPDALAALVESERATVTFLSTGVFHEVAPRRPGMFGPLRYLLVGGEAMNPNVARKVLDQAPPTHFINGYGPTENSVISTLYELRRLDEDAETVPIGRPVSNSTAYVLRPDLGLADIGEEGELCVGGDGVATGYYGAPELTRERFVPDPFSEDPGALLYRTGDRARWRADGVLEYLGRNDRQVKIRGFRVELGEIESTLAVHPAVDQAVVEAHRSGSGDRHVVAWVASARNENSGQEDELAERVRSYARDRLPLFMVPDAVRVVESFPLTPSGKVDRSRLPDPDHRHVEIRTPPETETERVVASIWCELLELPAVDREDDFFALGGRSLHTTRMVVRLEEHWDIPAAHGRFLIRCLLSSPTLREFARHVDELPAGTAPVANETVDFWAETRLDPALRFDAPPVENRNDPGTVLLTGATGFLGAFLVDRLVRHTRATVFCLTRAEDDQDARTRIAANMRRYGLSFDNVRHRVVPVVGDLARPALGVGERFDELAERIDLVVHNGSHVNFVFPYSNMRGANVGGSHEVIRLATTRRLKPVHYVSSITTIVGNGVAGVPHVSEDAPPAHPEKLSMGYQETKWVAEWLFRRASERGLPVSTHRPYEITGTSHEGIWNTETMMCALFRTIAETGVAPDVALPLDFVPVDVAAEALVHLITHEPPRGHVYHLTNPNDARLGLLVERLRARGYPVRKVPYDHWVTEMAELAATEPDHPLAPFIPVFADSANTGDMSVKEMYFADTFPTFGRENLTRALADSEVAFPPVDERLLDLYLDQFETSGFLNPALKQR